ncbi:unnamed protein product [Clavelina lepadiformis]|uniref:Uncharacterized protein n=1 Tax=Clavelina lepadiformis TaxID=159417 RepID=A0ABP0FRW4_CLALP
MAQATFIIGIIFALAGAALATVGFSTPSWISYAAVNIGLWQQCIESVCTPIGWSASIITTATRGAMIGGIVFYGMAGFLGLLELCNERNHACIRATMGAFYIVGGLLVGIGAGIFTGFNYLGSSVSGLFSLLGITLTVSSSISTSFGYSLYLAWAGAVCLFIGGIFYCICGCCSPSPQITPHQETRIIATAPAGPSQPGPYYQNPAMIQPTQPNDRALYY